jgi:hypothetical protein
MSDLLGIVDAPVGDNVRRFLLGHIWGVLSAVTSRWFSKMFYLENPGSSQPAPRCDPFEAEYE